MRILICVGLWVLVSGCATTGPKLNCDESCAMENMVCTGQSMGETSGKSVINDASNTSVVNAISPPTVRSSSSSVMYHCVKDAAQSAKINEIRNAVILRQPKEKEDVLKHCRWAPNASSLPPAGWCDKPENKL